MNNIDLKLILDSKFCERFSIDDKNAISFKMLAQGEYNINYVFQKPKSKESLVLRINTGSQMNLKNQITYEYKALNSLKSTNITPIPLYVDDSKELIPYGFLVMNYIEGRPLNYDTDMELASKCLAKIHCTDVDKECLLSSENSLKAIWEECLEMSSKYINSNMENIEVKKNIELLLKRCEKNVSKGNDFGNKTIINTELNSGNFIVNDKEKSICLVDWEKPLLGYVFQDLGHFLAPTTTFWKTDKILSKDEKDFFINKYCSYSENYKNPKEVWECVKHYIAMNCLRGVTWCSMAYIEYESPERLIKNEYTYNKIKKYLSLDFLEFIKEEYINE